MPSEPAPVVILRPPGRPAYAVTLDQLTAQVAAARTLRPMNFLDKMKLAGTVAADLEAAAERDADALIARAAELDAKRAKAFAPHFKRLDASHDALDGLEHALDYLGNGAPAVGSDELPKPAALVSEPEAAARGWNRLDDGSAYHGTEAPKS